MIITHKHDQVGKILDGPLFRAGLTHHFLLRSSVFARLWTLSAFISLVTPPLLIWVFHRSLSYRLDPT
jgi:hypothetical protein